jgi:hypothetical protein
VKTTRKGWVVAAVGGALAVGIVLTGMLSGSDQAALWAVRVILALIVLRYVVLAVFLVWVRPEPDAPRSWLRPVLVGTSLAKALGLAVILATNFSGLGNLLGLGILLASFAVDLMSGKEPDPEPAR